MNPASFADPILNPNVSVIYSDPKMNPASLTGAIS